MILFDKDEYGYKLVDIHDNKTIRYIDEPCICFSYTKTLGGCLHKFGDYKLVKEYYDSARQAYINIGFPQEAADLKIIHGMLPIEELNKCIEISGYVGKLYEKINNL